MGHIPIGRNNHRCSSQQAPRVTIVHTNQPNLQLTRDMAQLNEKTNLMANELQNQKISCKIKMVCWKIYQTTYNTL